MAQSPVTGSVQQHRQDTDETIPLKRAKKEPGAPTGKNVVVLKNNDVKEKDGIVFMPNTIDMAKLKKPQRGQFKTNVQISSKMTQSDIKQILEEAFPFLKNKRFYCAGAADNRTRLHFHGDRRIWDGRLIKQKIKGNSALYIYADEGIVGTPDSTGSKHLTLKRSHDQMMTKNKSRIETATPSAATDVMAQGSFVAPLGMAQNSISTASYSQTRETVPQTPDRFAATGNNTPPLYRLAHHSGLPGMVTSSLTSKMGSLDIASSSSGWEMDEYAQTAASEELFTYVPLEAMGKQGQGNGNGSIVGNSKQSSVVNTDEIRARDTSCGVDAIEGPNKDVGTSGSDYESQLSDSSAVENSTDSGIEGSDGLRVNGDIFDTESRQHLPSDASPTSSFSQMLNTVMPFSATEETSSCETADDITAALTDLFGTVEGICPEDGSVEGGFKFYISFTEALSDEIQYGEAHFERAANVPVQRLNPFTMYGNVPRSPSPGKVTVTVITKAGKDLGFTLFNYIDDKENMLEQLVNDPMLQAKYFLILSTKFANGNLTSNSNIAQAQGQRILEENDFPVQTKQQQSVKFLRLMVYTAAETDAQDFIEMVFSTSAGQIVFNSYKDRTPLPEDVARANGHKELAQYLQDVNTRLSKEAIGDVQCYAIDWLELVKAVQKRCYSAVETKQKQSVELLQLLDYSAVKRDALWFIESVTSAGQDNLDYYKDRRPWPENVARAHGNEELAPFQDVHTRLSLNKNVHSTLTDWLELEEAEQKQSLATLESPTRVDLSDDDDDDSSDYFADAETSSCGSSDDNPEWPEISEKKEPFEHDEISSEVQITSENNDLSMTCSSKASFTKNERIIKGESTKGQTSRDDICFVVKQGYSCLDKGRETGEYSELSSSLSCVADLYEMSCEDLNNENSITKGPCIPGEMSNEVQSITEFSPGTAFSAIDTPTALHETEESPAKRNLKRRAYKEGPIVEPWFGLGWSQPSIFCLLAVLLIIIFVVMTIFPGTTMLSAETSTTNSPSQYRRNCASCNPCPPSYGVKNTCAEIQETDCRECWLGYDYSNTTVSKCCMARSGSADGIYNELSAHDRLCTRQWSTKILSVQSAAVLTVNTSSGTCPYEKKESPGEPSLSQKDASYKKPIQQLSGFFLGVLAALVTTVVAVQWYKKRKRLYQSNDNDAQQSESNNRATTEQQSIPELQHTLIRDLLASRLDDKDPDGEERETSELSKPERITSLPALFVMSCEDPGEDSLIIRTSRNNMAKQPKGTAFSTINTPTALHETEESPAKRNHRKRGAYKEGPIIGPWFELGWFHLAIVLILVLPTIIVVILIFPGTTMLSAETSTTNFPSQHRWNRASCIPCVECARSRHSGCADGIYVDYSTSLPFGTTRKWSTKTLSVQIVDDENVVVARRPGDNLANSPKDTSFADTASEMNVVEGEVKEPTLFRVKKDLHAWKRKRSMGGFPKREKTGVSGKKSKKARLLFSYVDNW